MVDIFAARFYRALLLIGAAVAWTAAFAANQTVFWLEPRSNTTFDRQVVQGVADRAGLVVLRAHWNSTDPDYTLKAVVNRFKAETGEPVLSYAWANRYTKSGRSEADLLRNFKVSKKNLLATIKGHGGSQVDFLDIRDPNVRNRVVSQFVRARDVLGVNGFAVDLSTRTPAFRPKPLAKRCQQEVEFCSDYATGMDDLFKELRSALGSGSMIAYNGLFNFNPGQLEDQAKLLEWADAAAIEYFGMDPDAVKHSFTENIRPFLDVISTLPAEKSVLVFGRGPWSYTDYMQDYLWQRYLYACFLLAARPNDFFKYHASFQVPTQRGRTGGLGYYADWDIDLGPARSLATQINGLWVREFADGLVVVAPDDGRGGMLPLAKTYFTPEGNVRQNKLRLAAGEGVILLNSRHPELRKPPMRIIGARTMAGWNWGGAQLDKLDGHGVLRLQAEKQPGEHDVVLDFVRSVNPYEHLEIDGRLLESSPAILAVAEVDDPSRKHTHVVLKISSDEKSVGRVTMEESVPLRSATARSGRENWPTMQLKKDLGKGSIGIGAAALDGSGYKFRRWSHLRLAGAVAVSRITLSNPTKRM